MPVSVDLFKVPILGDSARKLQQEAAAKGRAEGKAEGHAEGHAEGLASGEAVILICQTEKRFGKLPKWAERRIKSASSEERAGMALRIIDAASLKEALGG